MYISINGINSRLSFAPEYTGASFKVIKDGKVYTGVFTESTTPVILTQL
jgi:hypothetical protein